MSRSTAVEHRRSAGQRMTALTQRYQHVRPLGVASKYSVNSRRMAAFIWVRAQRVFMVSQYQRATAPMEAFSCVPREGGLLHTSVPRAIWPPAGRTVDPPEQRGRTSRRMKFAPPPRELAPSVGCLDVAC